MVNTAPMNGATSCVLWRRRWWRWRRRRRWWWRRAKQWGAV
jgi:hypothetical protein